MYNRQKISGPSSNRRKAGNIQTNKVQSNPVANQKADTGNPGCFLILMLIFGILCVLFSIPLFLQDETKAGLLFVFAGIMSAMPLVRFYIIKSNNKTNAAQEETLSMPDVEEPTTYVDEDVSQEVQGTAIDKPVESYSKHDVIDGSDVDPLFEKAAHFIVMRQQCSETMLGAKFGIGFNRAKRLVGQLEQAGIVVSGDPWNPKEVVCKDEEHLAQILQQSKVQNLDGGQKKTPSGKSNSEKSKIVIPNIDPLFKDVVLHVVMAQGASTKNIQRVFSIEQDRANRLLEQMEIGGFVGKEDEDGSRPVLCKSLEQMDYMLEHNIALSEKSTKNAVSNKPQNIDDIMKKADDQGLKSLTNSSVNRMPDSLFQEMVSDVNKLYEYLRATSKIEKVLQSLNVMAINDSDGEKNILTIDFRLAVIVIDDLLICYKNLGYDVNGERVENMAITLFVVKLLVDSSTNLITQDFLTGQCKDIANNFLKSLETKSTNTLPEDKLILPEILKQGAVDKSIINRYLTLMYELSSTLAKVDGKISVEESTFMSKVLQDISELTEDTNSPVPKLNNRQEKKDIEQSQAKPKAMKAERELNKLIGLESVKEEVARLTNFVKVQQMRKEKGMATSPISYHCVFTGNPGTGKTTVARILAEIYRDLGLLSKGHLIETDRSGLVAEYVGQTAVKTNKIIDSAIGGVLFIDEAYSLVQGGNNDFGMEAISTLLKRMEDDRDKLVVVLAGYGNEMKTFIDSNPGLQSRFNRYIHFPDYSAKDLMDIAKLDIKKLDYKLDKEANTLLSNLFLDAVAHKDKNFGNGRFARNIVEKILENQATRLSSQTDITEDDLRNITVADIPNLEKKPEKS